MHGDLAAEVAAILSAQFHESALDQKALGRLSDVSQTSVSRYLSGGSVPTLDTLDRLCAALGLSIVDVVAAADAARRRN